MPDFVLKDFKKLILEILETVIDFFFSSLV